MVNKFTEAKKWVRDQIVGEAFINIVRRYILPPLGGYFIPRIEIVAQMIAPRYPLFSFIVFSLASFGTINIVWNIGTFIKNKYRYSDSRLIKKLEEYATDASVAHIQFANNRHRDQAENLKSIFELARWKTNYTNVPLEFGEVHRTRMGIEIGGFNNHLVKTVTSSLKKYGMKNVYDTVEQTKIKSDNPKYESTQRRVNITIGHQDLS